jgi:hypothetical protein
MNWVLLGITIYLVLSVSSIIVAIIYSLRHPKSVNLFPKENPKTERIINKTLLALAYSVIVLVAINIIQGIIFGIWLIIKTFILKIS